jgi:hypothetical protein
LIYYPINAVITAAAQGVTGIRDGATITHVKKKTNYETFEKIRGRGPDTV